MIGKSQLQPHCVLLPSLIPLQEEEMKLRQRQCSKQQYSKKSRRREDKATD